MELNGAKILYTIHTDIPILGDFKITQTLVSTWIVMALLTALGYWNEWFLCMLYVTEKKLYPLQYLLMEMQKNSEFLARNSSMIGASGAEALKSLPSQTMRMAVVVFIVLPIACAYPFFQRYVVAGLTIGSVKG